MAERSWAAGGTLRVGLVLGALWLPSGCRASEDPPPPAGAGPAGQVTAGATAGGQGRVAYGSALVIFGADTVVAEVARTPQERERGLMYRTELAEGTGMIFVFPEEEQHSFWMSNTYVALDVAFFDAGLRIVDIQQMEPETTDFHDSRAPAMYALEVPKGWFAAHGIGIGDRARLVVGAG